jgi:hypothetical protein
MCVGERGIAYKLLVRKPDEQKPLERPRYRRENLEDVRREGLDWIHLVQNRDQWWALMNAVTKLLGSIKSRKFLERLTNY